MKLILQDNNTYIISIQRGEEIMEEVKNFCIEHKIVSASFSAIGAINEAELAFYDLEVKKYITTTIKEDMELASLLGNVSYMDGNYVVHNHGVFSGRDFIAKGGHVAKAMVSGACEVTLQKIEGSIERAYDNETGLNLMA
ncbi:MAG: DNA-binding protein [bacterium]|nr:DNA-binding protein [bacterium]